MQKDLFCFTWTVLKYSCVRKETYSSLVRVATTFSQTVVVFFLLSWSMFTFWSLEKVRDKGVFIIDSTSTWYLRILSNNLIAFILFGLLGILLKWSRTEKLSEMLVSFSLYIYYITTYVQVLLRSWLINRQLTSKNLTNS